MSRPKSLLLMLALLLGGCAPLQRETPTSPQEGEVPLEVTATPSKIPTLPMPATATPLPSPTGTPVPPTPGVAMPPGPYFPFLLASRPITITTIQMLDPQTGWGIGYQGTGSEHILVTTDGGQTWSDRTPREPKSHKRLVASAYFANKQNAWVIYTPEGRPPPEKPALVWRTTDGGQTWLPSRPLPTEGMEAFFIPAGFAFTDSQNGWLLVHIDAGMSHDYSYLFTTSDGGENWQRIADPYGVGLQSLYNTGLAFADDQFGWVTKDNLGVMMGAFFEQSTDGGVTWDVVFLPSPPEIDWINEPNRCATQAPVFLTSQAGAMIVNCQLFQSNAPEVTDTLTYIYTTPDRGQTWQHARLPSTVNSLLFLNETTGWAFGREHFKTTDGGLSWVAVKSVNWDGQFSFVDEQRGWAVARNNDEIALVHTEDGGKTWQLLEPRTAEK